MSGRFILNEKITDYLEDFYCSPDEATGLLRKQAEEAGIPIILRDTERFLITLIRMIHPQRILEVGTAVGYSAICFARTAGPSAEIVTLEKDPAMADTAEENFRRLGYAHQITVIRGDAADQLSSVEGSFDLVFIDAAKSHYEKYWDLSLPHCRQGSVIVCDNVLLRGAVTDEGYDSSPRRHRTSIRRMRAFTKRITEDPAYETAIMTVGDGLSLSYIRTVENV